MFDAQFFQKVSSYSIVVLGATEGVKKLVKIKGVWAFVVSGVVAIVTCLPEIAKGILPYGIMVVAVVLASNGIFKALHIPVG